MGGAGSSEPETELDRRAIEQERRDVDLDKRSVELDRREVDLDKRAMELEKRAETRNPVRRNSQDLETLKKCCCNIIRMAAQSEEEPPPCPAVVSAGKDRPLAGCDGERKIRDDSLGIQKPVRQNSKTFNPPNNGTFSDEAKQSTDSIKSIRFVVLGSDEVLVNEACDIILGSTDKTIKRGTCEFREACVHGRHVSVVKAPTYWLEHLKTYLSFSKGVRSMKMDMVFCNSLVFPGPHAFLLVLGDVRNSGKEHYLLQALSEVFGQEALDYSMVLFMHEYRDSDIGRNHCVRKCRKRFHILKKNEDSVLKLFHDATGTIIKQRKANFFTKDLDLLDKAESYFKREFDAKYEKESSLRADSAEMKTTEERLRTNITEMEKQNSKNVRELQDLREELDAHRAAENQLRKELDASRSSECELKEELCALRYYKRLLEHTASNERESQPKSDYEKLQRELEQLKGNEKRLEENPRESKDRPKEEFPPTKIQLEHSTLQEQKEAQAPAQEEHDRPRTLDRGEVELDERKRKLLMQTDTGSEHGHPISIAVTPPSDKPLEFEGLKLVRQNSKKLDQPDVSAKKVKPLSEREREIDLQSIKGEGVKPARKNSIQYPPNMSEDKPQEDTGYLEFEGLKL